MSATHRALRLLVAAFLCGPLFVAQPQDAKKETDKAERLLHLVGGERHGRSFFPKVDYPEVKPLQEGELDFRHFHTYDEVNQLLRKWARHYPDLVELYSVGKSFEGRDIWQVTVTNRKAGKDTDKPAMYIEGGRHSAEITSSESVLWLLHHLLTQYGQDPDITRLVDTKALYLRVMNNPDGAEPAAEVGGHQLCPNGHRVPQPCGAEAASGSAAAAVEKTEHGKFVGLWK